MIRLATLGLLGLTLALPTYALAGERAPRSATPTSVAENATEVKRAPAWAMPHRKAEHRRRFSRDLDPRYRELLSVPTLAR